MKPVFLKYFTTCFTFAFAILLTSSCNEKVKYNQWIDLESFEWHQDSALYFDFEINDTDALYNVSLGIRHINQYPYQNLWVFSELERPDNISFSDTIQYKLADQYGVWYGKRSANKYNYSKRMYSNIKFVKNGQYTIKLKHGMRNEQLQGIASLGIKIESIN